jgi:hypothetical protein
MKADMREKQCIEWLICREIKGAARACIRGLGRSNLKKYKAYNSWDGDVAARAAISKLNS